MKKDSKAVLFVLSHSNNVLMGINNHITTRDLPVAV